MSNIYEVSTIDVFYAVDRSKDLTNMHNVFSVSLNKTYKYNRIEEINHSSMTVIFAEETVVDELIINEINEMMQSYKISSQQTAVDQMIEAIDAKTRLLISQGARFDDQLFSLSDSAQRNWIAIKASLDTYEQYNAYPVPVTTLDDSQYLLYNADHVRGFTASMMLAVAEHYNSGRDLKLQLKAANTVAELRAIKDRRKFQ